MEIAVLYFAGMSEHTGKKQEVFDLPNPCGSADVLNIVSNAYPHLSDLCNRSRVAIGHAFVKDPVELSSTSEVAIIPPVSGG